MRRSFSRKAEYEIDRAPEALSHDQLGMRHVELRVKARPRRSLHAVVRPQNLRAVRDLDRVERAPAGMRAGERSMPGGMPVLGQDHMGEGSRQPVDRGDDRVAVGHRERAARAEIVLDIDDQQNVSIIWRHCPPRSRGMISLAMIST